MKRPYANHADIHANGRRYAATSSTRRWTWFIVGTIVLLSAPACASKKAGQSPDSGPDGRTPQVESNIDHYIDSTKQQRWTYASLPTPEPSSKPNYLLKSFTFEKASANLDAEARGVLSTLAEDLNAKSNITVLIIGMCDANAEAVNAQNLGMNRAQNARKVLLDRGVGRDRIEIASFGSSQAKAPASETVGQTFDRRVEVWLLGE